MASFVSATFVSPAISAHSWTSQPSKVGAQPAASRVSQSASLSGQLSVCATACALAAAGRKRSQRAAPPSGSISRCALPSQQNLCYYEESGGKTTFPTPEGEEYEMDTTKILGVGGQGKVHPGRNTKTNEVVAIKAMPVKHLILDEMGAAKMALIDEEIKVLKSVGAHPNIAKIFSGVDAYRKGTSDYPHAKYLVMEIVEGKELAEHIVDDGPLQENVAKSVFTQVVAGLQHMHSQGVVHRDLKLANIMVAGDHVQADSKVKLIDFGVAKNTGDSMFKTLVGTLEIMPPEMAKAKLNYIPEGGERKLHTAKFKSPQEANPGFGFIQLTQEGFGARLNNVDPQGQAGSQGVKDDWVLLKINDINVEKMLFKANPDDNQHAKVPKIVNTLMELTTDFTLEMLECEPREFTAKVDTWALGVVLYTMLVGKSPFNNELEIIQNDYDKAAVSKFSPGAQALLAGLLEKNPAQRMSLAAAMAHSW